MYAVWLITHPVLQSDHTDLLLLLPTTLHNVPGDSWPYEESRMWWVKSEDWSQNKQWKVEVDVRGKRFLRKHSVSGFHLQLCVFPTNADKYNNSCENAHYFRRLIHWLLVRVVWLCTDWWWPFKLKKKPSKNKRATDPRGIQCQFCKM